MAVDYTGFALPKGRPKALDKADKAKALAAKDRDENIKAKMRARGRCEVLELVERLGQKYPDGSCEVVTVSMPCMRPDTQTHHMIGGIGRRNKGRSIMADYKLRVCAECHAAITANILQPTTAEHTAATVKYRRMR
jgi:hypothetical protein